MSGQLTIRLFQAILKLKYFTYEKLYEMKTLKMKNTLFFIKDRMETCVFLCEVVFPNL